MMSDLESELLDELQRYFKNTPRNQVLKDWEDCQEVDKEGHVKINDFLNSLSIKKVRDARYLLQVHNFILSNNGHENLEIVHKIQEVLAIKIKKSKPHVLTKEEVKKGRSNAYKYKL